MKFTAAFIALAVATLASAAPTTAQVPPEEVSNVLQHLDSQNAIQWSTADGDFQTATIPSSQLQDAYASLQARDEPQPGPNDWKTTTKQVAGLAVKYYCINGDTDTIKNLKSQAAGGCSALATKIPEIQAAEKTWSIAKSASQYFFAETDSKSAPKFTQTICEKGIDLAADELCKFDKKNSHGAILELGNGLYVGVNNKD